MNLFLLVFFLKNFCNEVTLNSSFYENRVHRMLWGCPRFPLGCQRNPRRVMAPPVSRVREGHRALQVPRAAHLARRVLAAPHAEAVAARGEGTEGRAAGQRHG